MILFILTATVIVILGHLGLYGTWVKFFGIHAGGARRSLLTIILVLSVSFSITSVLVFWKEAFLTNLLYTISSVWLGFVWYASIAAALTWGAWLLGRIFSANVPMMAVTVVLLAAALGVSTYGVWNAWHPVVRQFSVTIPNLPEAWRGQKIVQLSDIHLGPVHRQIFLQDVVQQVNDQQPAAIFITGDLFDGGGRDLNALAEPLQDLRSTNGTYYITGNHETYVGVERSLAAIKNLPLTILRDQIVDVAGIQVLGIDYPIGTTTKDVTPLLEKLEPAKPSIVLWHEPKYVGQIKNAGVNLLLAGHTHDGQLWPFGTITKWVYKGFHDGLHTEGTFNEYTSPGVGSWGPPMRIGNRPTIAVFTLQ
ncbi:MAG: metallophosphoesterase [bacterium]|nr:metallophosphoesterase [bacterium]